MFLGEYRHNLDYKGRLSVPKKYREELGSEAILTRGLDGCLFLYPKNSWDSLTKKMEELPLTQKDARAFARYLFGGAVRVEFDALGRIGLPGYLRDYAQIGKSCILIGVIERVEIWDQDKWTKLEKKLRNSAEETAERLTETGV